MSKELIPYIVPVLVLALVSWRLYRNAGGRPIKPQMLWLRPAILVVFLGLSFLHPPVITPFSLAVFAVAAMLGIGFGYVLASHQTLTIDQATGTITSKMSPVGIVLFLGLFALRFAMRTAMTGGQPGQGATHQSATVLMYTEVGLIFVLGLVAAQAWETWRRAKPLLDGHAAGKAQQSAE
ncbi:MAG: DUF1453 family protein [Rhizomicrobium sp.]|nr:DUF1453 family protein [Rhizomicrobium sp.]